MIRPLHSLDSRHCTLWPHLQVLGQKIQNTWSAITQSTQSKMSFTIFFHFYSTLYCRSGSLCKRRIMGHTPNFWRENSLKAPLSHIHKPIRICPCPTNISYFPHNTSWKSSMYTEQEHTSNKLFLEFLCGCLLGSLTTKESRPASETFGHRPPSCLGLQFRLIP